MNDVGELTGRKHKIYEYFGHPDAEHVTVFMSSSAETVKEVVNYMNNE
jgi:pyruvate/2-oxoacid:ferredoxin oxidoreductase alpha subunit